MDEQFREALERAAEETRAIQALSLEMALAQLDAPEADTRYRAVRRLGDFKGPEVMSALRRALQDPVIGVRTTTLLSLSRQESTEGVDLLLTAFREDGAAQVRRVAISLLACRDDLDLTPVLLDGLSDHDPVVLRAVISGLRSLRARSAAERLTPFLEHPDAMTRRTTCETLIAFGHRSGQLTSALESILDDPAIVAYDDFLLTQSETFGKALMESIAEQLPDEEIEPSAPPRMPTTRELLDLSRQPSPAD